MKHLALSLISLGLGFVAWVLLFHQTPAPHAPDVRVDDPELVLNEMTAGEENEILIRIWNEGTTPATVVGVKDGH